MKGGGLTARFSEALVMANAFHGKQIRKGTEARPIPYVAHLLEVAGIVVAESVPTSPRRGR